MPYLVIYNQQAGTQYASHKKAIIKFFEQQNLQLVFHNLPDDGSFSSLDPANYQRIICVGGDGTLKEIANWILKHNSTTPLAVVPKGSGNIVANSLDIPHNHSQALELAVFGPVTSIDVGLLNNREYFLVAAGMGMDAWMIKNTPHVMKRLFGSLAYLLTLAKAFFNLSIRKIYIKTDGMQESVRAQSVLVTNVEHFRQVRLSPESKINDGELNVIIFKPITLKDTLILLGKILMGDYAPDWRVTHLTTKKVYLLPLPRQIPMQVDGEVVELPYMDIEIVPKALRIVTSKEI